jgi:very-short-patch-repair endonuclease
MRFDGLVTPAVQRRMLEVARDFRREPQPSEAMLWQALRRKQLRGHKFRRQQPIGAFIVDFYCDAVGLVVEVDGPIHASQAQADAERQRILEQLGLRVLRVSSRDVESDLPKVIRLIEHALDQPPVPLSLGERG